MGSHLVILISKLEGRIPSNKIRLPKSCWISSRHSISPPGATDVPGPALPKLKPDPLAWAYLIGWNNLVKLNINWCAESDLIA
jgi:hypothetical protein